MTSLDHVTVVLVRPSRAANVAAACRAAKNMGVRRVTLVGSMPEGEPEDRRLAWNAWDVLDAVEQRSSLEDAVADAHTVVGTTSRPGPISCGPRQIAGSLATEPARELAVVFGTESHGLTDAELRLCHARVVVPTHPDQPSLNLAQAVLLVCYELYLARCVAGASGQDPAPERPHGPATAGQIETALAELEDGLLGIGYLDPQSPHHRIAEIRRLVTRAGPTEREVTLLRGVARQLRWAASVVERQADSEG